MATVRLRPPSVIRLGGSISYGSGEFFGQTANNLTNTLRNLQDVEALRKLADGDPETYLDYWKTRSSSVRGELKTEMQMLADKAQKNIVTRNADTAALADYARTNNHQKYLDYLIERAKTETNPSELSKIGTQINQLRDRIFKSGGTDTGIGGGYSIQDLKDARDEFSQAKSDADEALKNGPLTTEQLQRLQAAGKDLADVVQAAYDSNKGTLKKSALLGEANAARTTFSNYQVLSDKAATRSGASTGFALTPQGQSEFASSLKDKSLADQMKAWSDRISEINAAASTIHSGQVLAGVTSLLHESESKSDGLFKTSDTPTNVDTQSQKTAQQDAYQQYRQWAEGAKRAGGGSPATQVDFESAIRFGTSFSAANDLGIVQDGPGDAQHPNTKITGADGKSFYIPSDFPINVLSKDTKDAFAGYRPAEWDWSKGTFVGDPESVSNAKAIAQNIQARSAVPGSPYFGVSGTEGELFDAGTGKIDPSVLTGAGTFSARTSGLAGAANAARLANQEPNTDTGPQSPDAQERNALTPPGSGGDLPAEASQTNASGKPLQALAPENVDDHFQQGMADANTYLDSGQGIGDLPSWEPSDSEKNATPDWNTLFPFSTKADTGGYEGDTTGISHGQ